jgi:DNA repair exonuclease SbcCD ATPase subunit
MDILELLKKRVSALEEAFPQADTAQLEYEAIITIDILRAELESLRTENAAQALLIASLKEENESLVKQLDQNWVQHQEIVRAREQLSDTQRQNAELMQRVGEVAEAVNQADRDAARWAGADIKVLDALCDVDTDAIAASKFSNEVAKD